jgi:hypothetical protein
MKRGIPLMLLMTAFIAADAWAYAIYTTSSGSVVSVDPEIDPIFKSNSVDETDGITSASSSAEETAFGASFLSQSTLDMAGTYSGSISTESSATGRTRIVQNYADSTDYLIFGTAGTLTLHVLFDGALDPGATGYARAMLGSMGLFYETANFGSPMQMSVDFTGFKGSAVLLRFESHLQLLDTGWESPPLGGAVNATFWVEVPQGVEVTSQSGVAPLVVIPEPAVAHLLLAGLSALAWTCHARRRTPSKPSLVGGETHR